MSVTMYGIKNCDTVKKARRWLEENGIGYRFHDFRQDGLDSKQANAWLRELGSDQLVNRRGTTWRNLPDAEKGRLNAALLVQYPALIKRPLLDTGKIRHLGFSPSDYREIFQDTV